MNKKLPSYFISHGGGPWPWMPEQTEAYRKLKHSFEEIPGEVGEVPRAIVVISAHWEEDDFTVCSNPDPGMYYDYYGFPEHTYKVEYRAPGDEELAGKIVELAKGAGLVMKSDRERGFDHASFVPLSIMYPAADIPVVQVAIKKNYDVNEHLALGRALAPLREEGVLLVGSGLSYHNMRGFFERSPQVRDNSRAFDEWLQQVLCQKKGEERALAMNTWAQAPGAREVHPREDHLVPLFVIVGASGEEKSSLQYHESDFLGGISVSSFSFKSS